jgi:hypothetical protein
MHCLILNEQLMHGIKSETYIQIKMYHVRKFIFWVNLYSGSRWRWEISFTVRPLRSPWNWHPTSTASVKVAVRFVYDVGSTSHSVGKQLNLRIHMYVHRQFLLLGSIIIFLIILWPNRPMRELLKRKNLEMRLRNSSDQCVPLPSLRSAPRVIGDPVNDRSRNSKEGSHDLRDFTCNSTQRRVSACQTPGFIGKTEGSSV